MWEPLFLSDRHIFERQLGFSIPVDDQVLVIAYEGICLVNLTAPWEARLDDRYPVGGDIYDPNNQIVAYEGKLFHILGLYGGAPIRRSDRDEHLALDRDNHTLTIQKDDGTVHWAFHFETLSDDWAYATFSRDFNRIVLGLPYDLYAFRRAE